MINARKLYKAMGLMFIGSILIATAISTGLGAIQA